MTQNVTANIDLFSVLVDLSDRLTTLEYRFTELDSRTDHACLLANAAFSKSVVRNR